MLPMTPASSPGQNTLVHKPLVVDLSLDLRQVVQKNDRLNSRFQRKKQMALPGMTGASLPGMTSLAAAEVGGGGGSAGGSGCSALT